MIRLLRRIVAGVRWRMRRRLRPRQPVGRAAVGKRRFENLIVHVAIPPGYTTTVGAALGASARSLSRRGIVVLTAAEMRDIGRLGWSGVTDERDQQAFAAGLGQVVAARRITGPPRALIVSTGRALGGDRLGQDEWRRLRPAAAATLTDLIKALPGRRVTVVIELPDADGFGDEMLAAAVEDGRPPAAPRAAEGLYAELSRRVGRVRRVRRVITLVGADADPPGVAAAIEEIAGPIELEAGDAGLVTPRWTLRSMLAAAAVNDDVAGRERQMTHYLLRNRLARPPARPPRAILPPAVAPTAHHVASRPEPLDLHLHIGLQKTATTTIQAALHQGRSRLADQGVAYVGRRFMMRIKDLQAWRAYPHTGKTSIGRFAEDLRRTVWEHRTAGGGAPLSTVLISNEALVGAMEKGPFLERPFRPRAEGAISDILDILQPDTCHLILVTRRQDTLLESQYMWQIHGGGAFTFERYLESFLAHPEALSYHGLGERLESLPGVTGVTMHPFETIRSGLDRFINALVAGTGATLDLTGLAFDPERNPSYSGRALEIALAINPHLRGRKEHRVVRDHLRTAFPASQWGRVTLLDEATRSGILDGFAAENEAVFRRWMPAYPANTYAFSNSPGTGK